MIWDFIRMWAAAKSQALNPAATNVGASVVKRIPKGTVSSDFESKERRVGQHGHCDGINVQFDIEIGYFLASLPDPNGGRWLVGGRRAKCPGL